MTQASDRDGHDEPRTNPYEAAPEVFRAMLTLSAFVDAMRLERSLQELVKIRASQINGCAYCLHMHTRDARAAGESDERMHLLAAWRESPLFTPRERAALAWTEALTCVSETHAPDADYHAMAAQFTPREQVELTLLINMINAWNCFAVGFRIQHPVAEAVAA